MGASCSSTPEEINKKNNYKVKDNNESKNSPSKGYKASSGNNEKV